MPNWKKVIVSGSDAALSNLNVTGAVTGSNLLVNSEITSVSASIDYLEVNDKLQGNGSGFQFFAYNEDTIKTKFANWYSSNDRQYGMGQLWFETWFAAIDNGVNRANRRIGFYLEEPNAGSTDSGTPGQHPSNARFYVDINGAYLSGSLDVSGGITGSALQVDGVISATNTITVDSTGDARLVLDRAANANDSEIEFKTNGTTNWSIGTGQIGSESDFTFKGQSGTNYVKINQSGQADFFSAVTASAFIGDGSALTNLPGGVTGSDTQIQFNDNGELGASSNLVFSGSRLGVGLDNPAVTLHVDGFARLNGGLQLNTSNAQIYQIGNSSLRFGTDNTERVRIDASGNVGIGTTSPGKLFAVNGESQFIGESFFNAGFDVTAGTGTRFRNDIPLNFGTSRVFELVYDSTTDKLEFNSGSNAIMTLDGDGNLVVEGSITAQEFHTEFVSASIIYQSGSTKFGDTSDDKHAFTGSVNVEGNNTAFKVSNINSNGSDTGIEIQGARNGAVGTATSYIHFTNNDDNSGGLHNLARIYGAMASTGDNDGTLTLQSWNGSTYSTGIHINEDGKVGVGTFNTANRFGVNGDAQIGSNSSANAFGRLQVNQDANNDESGIGILSSGSARSMRLWVDESVSYISSGNGGIGILSLNQGGGNVGIGTTAPADKLQVQGGNVAIPAGILYNGAASNSAGLGLNNAWFDASGYYGMRFFSSTAAIGSQVERMRITNTGNVGIGTTGPTQKLEVRDGNLVVSGSSSKVAVGTATGVPRIYSNANQDLLLATANQSGSVVYLQDANGYVGIGTSSPQKELHVNGAVSASTYFGDASNLSNVTTTDGLADILENNNSAGGFSLDMNNNDIIGVNEIAVNIVNGISASLSYVTSSAGLFIDTPVTLRDGSTSDLALNFSSSANTGIYIDDYDASNKVLYIRANGTNVGTFNPAGITSNSNVYTGTTGQFRNYAGVWKATTGTAGGDAQFILNGKTIMHIDEADERVGIGTTNPAAKLDVSAASNDGIRIAANNALLGRTSAGDTQLIYWNGDHAYYGRNPGGAGTVKSHSFRTLGNTKMFITGSAVGINTQTPTEALTVEGNISASGDLYLGNNSTINFNTTTGTVGKIVGGSDLSFYSDNLIKFVESDANIIRLVAGTNSGTFNINTTGEYNSAIKLYVNGDSRINGDLTVTGIVTAQEFHTEFVSASIIYQSGSTQFGDTADDSHDFTGQVHVYRNATIGSPSSFTAANAGLRVQDNANSMYFDGNAIVADGAGNFEIGTTQNTGMFLFTSGSERMRIAADGNVGIGTTSPTRKLHVVGGSTYAALLDSDQDYTLGLARSGTEEWWLKTYTDGRFAIHENGVGDKVTIKAGGNVGIGTTSPSAKLHVSGTSDVLLIEGSGSTIFDVQGSQGQLFSVTDSLVGSLFSVNDISGLPIIEVFDTDKVVMGTFGQNTLVVTGSYVGIGTDTPNRPLTIETDTTDVLGALKIKNAGTGDASMFFTVNASGAIWQLGIDNSDGDKFKIGQDTQNADVGVGTKLTIDSSGNVGIGVTAPTQKLEVDGTGKFDAIELVNGGGSTTRGLFSDGTQGEVTLISPERVTVLFDSNNNDANSFFAVKKDNTDPSNATELFRVDSSGNVGIGTTKPTGSLHVAGAGYFEGESLTYGFDQTYSQVALLIDEGDYIYTKDSNVTLRKLIGKVSDIIQIGQTGTSLIDGIQLLPGTTNGYVSIHDNNTEYARFTGGNLGIGTTAPSQKLEVRDGNLIVSSSTSEVVIGTASGKPRMQSNGNQDLLFSTPSYTNLLYLQESSGKVGIGTTSPNTKLTVEGAVSASGGFYGSGANLTGITTSDGLATILGNGNDAQGTSIDMNTGDITQVGEVQATTFNGTTASLAYVTSSADLHIDTNVGIGATTPLRRLHVAGGNGFAVNASTSQYYGVYIPANGEGADPEIQIGDWHNAGARLQWDSSARSFNIDTQYSTGAGTFKITGNDFTETYLQVDNQGDVTVYNDLTVTGNAYATASWATNLVNIPDLTTVLTAGNGGGGLSITEVNDITATGTVEAGSFVETSARRFKENIEPIEGALDIVSNIDGVTFNRIGEESREYGFIADEVQTVAPELVSYDDTGQVHGVHYARTVAVLTEAVKELNDKVKAQDLFIRDLVARIEKLENK